MNRFSFNMPTQLRKSAKNPLPLLLWLLATIHKLGQSSLCMLNRRRWLRYGLLSLGMLVWLTRSKAKVYQTGDTQGWISGSKWLQDCVLRMSSEACQNISYWPIWNNALALMLSWFTGDQTKLWYYLNILSFVVYLLIILYVVRQLDFKWRLLIVYSILFSPLIFQVHSTFTEIQQGLFLTLALFGYLKKRMIVSSIFVVLSIITKETFIMLWFIILIFYFVREIVNMTSVGTAFITRDRLIGNVVYLSKSIFTNMSTITLLNHRIRTLIIGILFGSSMNFSFNYLRYHQFNNTSYFSSNTIFSMDVNFAVLNFVWSFISPNGGIIFSYGLFLAVTLLYLASCQRIDSVFFSSGKNYTAVSTIRTALSNSEETPSELLILIIITLSCGLFTTSLWWATFGWDTWGHRLIVPYIMPVLMLTSIAIQGRTDHDLKSTNTSEPKYLERNYKSLYSFRTVMKLLISIFISVLVMCGVIYNLVTIQTVYRQDIDVVGESLFSQPWCREMVSDSRGIRPYYWQCVLERFQYIPILHRPPKILGPEGKILISLAIMSVFVNLPCMRPWPQGNRLVEPHARSDRG